MKMKKILFLSVVVILIFSVGVMAKDKPSEAVIIFMGEILEVKEDNKGNTLLLVNGYLKAEYIVKHKIVAVVGPETRLVNCNGEKTNKLDYSKGNNVFILLSEAITSSIPEQCEAKQIQVCCPAN
jgi:hypothetical protein